MNFESLVGRINLIQDALQAQAAHAVNLSLTARNWLVGYYIVEFEQHGEDRAKYGEKLINRLAERINRKGFEPRSLRVYRRIYLVYPQLGTVIETYLQKNSLMLSDSGVTSIWQSLPAELQATENQMDGIWRSALAKLEEWSTPADRLFYKLNYTCLAYLTSIEDPLKRAFYEQETIRGCWTSRELDRHVSSQYYERMGLSKDKKALQRLTTRPLVCCSVPTMARPLYNTLQKVSRRTSSSASTACSCPPRTTSASTCWRISQKSNLRQ